MGPAEMVVAIVGITAIASVARAKYGYRRSKDRNWEPRNEGALAQENRELRDQMHGLKERIQVLERLATDDESDARRLDREIEKLRERPGLSSDVSGSSRLADKPNRE